MIVPATPQVVDSWRRHQTNGEATNQFVWNR